MEANLIRLSSPREADDVRLDADIRAAAERMTATRSPRSSRERLHRATATPEGEGRGPAEIADRFLDQRALAETHIEARGARNAARTFSPFVELARGAARRSASFARRTWLDFGAAFDEFAARAAAIAALAPPPTIAFEAGFGRPLDYYTGLVFEIRASASPQPISGGGRYDRLMEMLGAARPVPAIGFMIRLDLGGEHAA